MLTNIVKAILAATVLASCSDKTQHTAPSKTGDSNELDFSSLVVSQTGGGLDLAAFLESGEEVTAIDVVDGASEGIYQSSLLDTPIISDEVPQSLPLVQEDFQSTNNVKKGGNGLDYKIDELNTLNLKKNQTIASLTRLNEELILEIQRLRSNADPVLNEVSNPIYSTRSPVNSGSASQLQKLQSEIAMLKSNLLQKSNEIEDLRRKNDQFHNGIDSLQPKVNSSEYLRSTIRDDFTNNIEPALGNDVIESFNESTGTENCTLEFDAVVTLLNGKSKEVFYTEFFLISKSLPELLFDEGIYLKDFPQVSSFEQLWAQSRKSPFVFPGIYKRIRNVLLSQVEQGRGFRVRTDIDGFAEFKNLKAGSFYIVGTAPVGKSGAVWNLPVRLRSGINKTSLTLANANWRE
jgi:hypothetical protein